MAQCHNCGGEFPQEQMADWTICFSCISSQQKEMGYAYTDSLGIGWTQEEIMQAGGIESIEHLCRNSR